MCDEEEHGDIYTMYVSSGYMVCRYQVPKVEYGENYPFLSLESGKRERGDGAIFHFFPGRTRKRLGRIG
jgi:hypothetical protein